MTKQEFLSHVRALYLAANLADHDTNPSDQAWMPKIMAGRAGCAHLDAMLFAMLECDALTSDEHAEFYDNL